MSFAEPRLHRPEAVSCALAAGAPSDRQPWLPR